MPHEAVIDVHALSPLQVIVTLVADCASRVEEVHAVEASQVMEQMSSERHNKWESLQTDSLSQL